MSLPALKVKERLRTISPPLESPESTNPLPRAFSLMKIQGQGSMEEGKLHKKLFEEEEVCTSPVRLPIFYQNYQRHRRVSSTIVKNIEQSYDFCDAIQSQASDEDVSNISAFSIMEEQPHAIPKTNFIIEGSAKRSSMFASTAEAKTSRGNSGYDSHYNSVAETVKEERYSTIYTLSSETPSKPTTQKSIETDPDIQPRMSDRPHGGNTTTLGVSTVQTQEEVFEVELFKQSGPFHYERKVRTSSLGLLPTRTHCFKCNTEVVTDVKLRMPKVSFWRTMCCVSDIMGECGDAGGLTNFQEFQHYCSFCRTLLGAVNPASFH
mmetsp:Transcript_3760/g.8017  ORF Transcript_3760/g.8017 Transcript_3760/m.8017 type:complete len:321 (-) Transcript_3760:41-1003(-)